MYYHKFNGLVLLLCLLLLSSPGQCVTLDSSGLGGPMTCQPGNVVQYKFDCDQNSYIINGQCIGVLGTWNYEIQAVWKKDSKEALESGTVHGDQEYKWNLKGSCTDDPWLYYLGCSNCLYSGSLLNVFTGLNTSNCPVSINCISAAQRTQLQSIAQNASYEITTPSNIGFKNIRDNEVTITWQDNSTNEHGFVVWRQKLHDSQFVEHTVGKNVTQFTDTGLSPHTTYQYRVRAFCNNSYSDYTAIHLATTMIAPTLEVILGGDQIIWIMWENAGVGDTYVVEYQLDGDFHSLITVHEEEHYKFQNWETNKTYKFRVKVQETWGMSSYSNVVSINTPAQIDPAALQNMRPPAPTNLTAVFQNNSIILNWTDNSSAEEGFLVEQYTVQDGTFDEIATVGPNVTTYTQNKFIPDTTYTYRVRAYIVLLKSTYSNNASVTTSSVPSGKSTSRAPGDERSSQMQQSLGEQLEMPGNFKGKASSSTSITLTWQDKSQGNDGFVIERKSFGETFSEIAKIGKNKKKYVDKKLKPNTTYIYRMKAFSKTAESDYTKEISLTTPDKTKKGSTKQQKKS